MSSTPPPEPQQKLMIDLPAEEEAGHYADFANIWHNQETFILDFATLTQPPELQATESGEPVVNLKARVVTRVRIPASQVWEVMKAMEKQLTAWEAEKTAMGAQGRPPATPEA